MKIRAWQNGGPSRFNRMATEAGLFVAAAILVAGSAGLAKTRGGAQPLAKIDVVAPAVDTIAAKHETAPVTVEIAHVEAPVEPVQAVRWFNGRPVRPVRTVWLTTTAYSPDARSCGKFADGITASNKSIWTNGMKLVAADTKLLPIGTMLSIPGYDDHSIVPVLDRGGAIKGDRLDLLFPSHHEALQWGVQRLPVTIWDYADEQG